MNEILMSLVFETQTVASQLSVSSEELASSSEEVASSAESVASTEQQITKGAMNQVNMVVETQKLILLLNDGVKEIKHSADEITQVVHLIHINSKPNQYSCIKHGNRGRPRR